MTGVIHEANEAYSIRTPGQWIWICQCLISVLFVTGVIHEANEAYSIQNPWSMSHWLEQCLTLPNDTWTLSKLSVFYWILPLFILLVLMGDELFLVSVTLLYNAKPAFWSQAENRTLANANSTYIKLGLSKQTFPCQTCLLFHYIQTERGKDAF